MSWRMVVFSSGSSWLMASRWSARSSGMVRSSGSKRRVSALMASSVARRRRTALIISHDRWFWDRVATHILAFEGESEVRWFPGNYSEYAEDRRRRLGAVADRPHRITYRKLRRV